MTIAAFSTRPPRFANRDFRALLISGFFVLLSLVLLASPLAGPMRYGFPLLSVIFAGIVYWQSKPIYAGFVVWLWMLAPLARRIVEYRAGGSAALIIGSPFLACAIPVLLSFASLGELFTLEGYPVFFASAGLAYGVGVGVLLRNHIPLIASGIALWVAPLLFAIFLVHSRAQIREIRESIEKALIWGMLAIGAYGLYQYFILAPWDALWIETSSLVSIGSPEPQQMRVFSTMNSPQGLAVFLIAGIFIALRSGSKLKWLAIPLASFSLLLTQSRTAWFGFIAGFLYLFFYLPVRQKMQIAIVGFISVILVLIALQGEQKATLTARLQTLTAPNEDGSFSTRMAGYASLLPTILPNPFGSGIGIDERADNSPTVNGGEGLGSGDSTIIAVLLSLGLPGTLVYVSGLATAVFFGFRHQPGVIVSEDLAIRAIIIALAVSAPANDILLGSSGFMTWAALLFSYIHIPEARYAVIQAEVPQQLATS